MKKLRLIIFALLTLALFNMNVNAGEWWEIGSGEGTGGSSAGGSNCGRWDACYCNWNNNNQGILKISIIYYDGNIRSVLGKPTAYYNVNVRGGANLDATKAWVHARMPYAIYKSWLPYNNTYNVDSQAIEDALIGGDQKENGYTRIKGIFNDVKVDYDELLAAVSSNGTYVDDANPDNVKVYNNMVNDKIKSGKGAAAKGVRIIVEPLVTIQSAVTCSFPPYKDRLFTVKNLFAFAYGKSENNVPYFGDNHLRYLARVLWLEEGDAGYAAASGNVDLAQVSSPWSGWGLNIYGPFDDVQTNICDPDQEYEGYTSGVQYCCKKEGITPGDKSKNKTQDEGGNLKRKLTDYEINSECSKQKCDPNIDGVDKCCVECDVTPGNLKNNHESDCMTSPIDPADLVNSTCNKGKGEKCDYALKVDFPGSCSESQSGHAEDIASWDCIFNSTNNKDVKDHYYNAISDKNNYCAVYCKEEVDMLLPNSGVVAKQGRFLILGDIYSELPDITDKFDPVTYKGKRTCRVTAAKGSSAGTINKTRFLGDMEQIEDDIRTYWDAWKILEAQQKACTSGSGRYNNVDYTCNVGSDGNKPNYSTKIADAKRKYEEAVKTRKGYIDQINACTKYATNDNYNFEPTVQFEYAEPVYGFDSVGNIKKWTLDILEKKEVQKVSYDNKVTENIDIVYANNNYLMKQVAYKQNSMYECSGDKPCTKTGNYKFPLTSNWESRQEVEIKYTLPENLYRFISKSTARSFSSKEAAGGENSVDMEMSNLPIHVSTKPGYYDFKITTTSLGDNNKFNQYLINDKPFNKVDYSQIENYSCKFKVDCEDPLIIPDIDDYCEDCEDSDLCTDDDYCPPTDPNYPDCKGGGGDDDGYCPPTDPDYPDCKGGGGDDGGYCPPTDPDYPNCKGGGGDDGGYCPPTDPDYPNCKGGGGDGGDPNCDPKTDPNCDKGTGGDGGDPSCDPKTDPNCGKGGQLGVNLIYRPISLISISQAFPGDSGSGRVPGKNWKNFEGFIIDNRGVTGYEVYKQSPMYEITLTPSLMQEIRQYNKTLNSKQITIYEGNTAKTGIAGYADYDSMQCQSNGKKCVSTKIRDWGVDGCGVGGFDSSKFRNCTDGVDIPWSLNQ